MMSDQTVQEMASAYIDETADEIVAEWIDWVRSRSDVASASALPKQAIENHIPPVVRALGDFLRDPIEAIRTELIGHLRMHGQIRRDQGYSIEEMLAEFDGLAAIITNQLREAVKTRQPDAEVSQVADLFTRLSTGLRSINHVAMATFEEAQQEKRKAVAGRLEEFARAISHELRNPLSVIQMSAGTLKKRAENGAIGDRWEIDLERIISATDRAVSMLETIRMLAIAENAWSGDRMVSIAQAIDVVLRETAEPARDAGVELLIRGELPGVKIEAILGFIVLSNLVTNAIKYADQDKDERWVEVSMRLLSEEHGSGLCEITVADNGIGIREEMLGRVTQKGMRVHPEQSYGTGMGLYIVDQTITERGGSMAIESRIGQGTSVRVRVRCLSNASRNITGEESRASRHVARSVQDEMDQDDRRGDKQSAQDQPS